MSLEAVCSSSLTTRWPTMNFIKIRSLIRPPSFVPSGLKLLAQSICRRRAQFARRADSIPRRRRWR